MTYENAGKNGADQSTVESLQVELKKLSDEVSSMVSHRAHQAEVAAKDAVEDYPMASMAAAFAAGAVIGLLVFQSHSSRPRSSFDDMRDELSDYTEQMKRKLRSASRQVGLSDNLERLGATFASADAKSNLAPALDRVLGWLGQAKDAAQSAVNTAVNKVS